MIVGNSRIVKVLAVPLVGLLLVLSRPVVGAQAKLPERLTDAEFWQLVTDLSEPAGAFHQDNFTSNERAYADAAATLAAGRPGGAYIGVGPEQNFNYIAAMRPQIAFIVDIRRQMLMQHLLFMALFDLSKDRADFIAQLFSRPRPAGVSATAAPAELWAAFPAGPEVKPERALYDKNRAAIESHLTVTRAIPLAAEDLSSLAYVYNAFFTLGPQIHYGGYSDKPNVSTGKTNFADLAMAADTRGVFRSFLGSDANFQYIKSLHARHLIVPLQGDFAGPRTIRGIGAYLRAHGLTVNAFYISNVEQYLWGQSAAKDIDVNGGWRNFYENASTLPIDDKSAFLRSPPVINQAVAPCLMQGFLRAFSAGRVQTRPEAQKCPQ